MNPTKELNNWRHSILMTSITTTTLFTTDMIETLKRSGKLKISLKKVFSNLKCWSITHGTLFTLRMWWIIIFLFIHKFWPSLQKKRKLHKFFQEQRKCLIWDFLPKKSSTLILESLSKITNRPWTKMAKFKWVKTTTSMINMSRSIIMWPVLWSRNKKITFWSLSGSEM